MPNLYQDVSEMLNKVDPQLTQTYLQAPVSDEAVAEQVCNVLYTLESNRLPTLHHRLFLKEAVYNPVFWIAYFKKQILPIIARNRMSLLAA